MSYIDANGILFLEETDPITPFQVTMNTMQAATSSALVAAVATVPRPKMYAVKGTGSYSLANNSYDWLGPMAAWTAIGPSTPPPEFSYATSSGTTLGAGISANVAGLFRLSASVQFDTNSTGLRGLRIIKNGSGTVVKKHLIAAMTGTRTSIQLDGTAYLAQGDRLGVQAIQSSGGDLALYSGEDSPSIVMEYLGP